MPTVDIKAIESSGEIMLAGVHARGAAAWLRGGSSNSRRAAAPCRGVKCREHALSAGITWRRRLTRKAC